MLVKGNSIWFGTNKGRVFRSTDKGYNWAVSTTAFGSTALIQSVAFKDSLTGIAVNALGPNANLNITTDGGITWSSQTFTLPFPIDNIAFVKGTDSTLIATCDWYRPIITDAQPIRMILGRHGLFLTVLYHLLA